MDNFNSKLFQFIYEGYISKIYNNIANLRSVNRIFFVPATHDRDCVRNHDRVFTPW